MNEIYMVGAFVVVIVPVIVAFWEIIDKSNKKTADLTAVIVKLNDKLDMLFNSESRQDRTLGNHEERIERLDHDVTVIQTDIDHYHSKPKD